MKKEPGDYAFRIEELKALLVREGHLRMDPGLL